MAINKETSRSIDAKLDTIQGDVNAMIGKLGGKPRVDPMHVARVAAAAAFPTSRHPHDEFGLGRQKKVPPIERVDISHELGIDYDDMDTVVYRYAPEPDVEPASGVGVLLVGMLMGGILASGFWLAAIALGVL